MVPRGGPFASLATMPIVKSQGASDWSKFHKVINKVQARGMGALVNTVFILPLVGIVRFCPGEATWSQSCPYVCVQK